MGSANPSLEYLSLDPELCVVMICFGVSLGDSSALGCLVVSKESPLHKRSMCDVFSLDLRLVLLLLAVDLVLFARE